MASTCSRFETLLSPFADDELASDEAAAVREHLAACQACRRVVESHQQVRARLLGARSPALEPAQIDALFRRARPPAIRWGQLAAAVIVAALVPAAIAALAPRARAVTATPCTCDVVAPELDLGL